MSEMVTFLLFEIRWNKILDSTILESIALQFSLSFQSLATTIGLLQCDFVYHTHT